MLFWLSKGFRWKNLEILDYNRTVIKTTITVDRAVAPTTALRRQLRTRLHRHPSTVGFLWTNSSDVTTTVTLSIEQL